jgi:hypothetical protein
MKKDLSPGSDPECHTLLKAIHERIAHSSLWPRCECPWSARYSDGFHGRRLTGTNTPTWNEFPAEHFFFRPRTFGPFVWFRHLRSHARNPRDWLGERAKARKMDCYPSEIDRNSTGIAFSSNIYIYICFYFIINIQSHANKKNERLLVSFHFLKKKW